MIAVFIPAVVCAAAPADPAAHAARLVSPDWVAREAATTGLAIAILAGRDPGGLGTHEHPEVRARYRQAGLRAAGWRYAAAAACVDDRYGLLPHLDAIWYCPRARTYVHPDHPNGPLFPRWATAVWAHYTTYRDRAGRPGPAGWAGLYRRCTYPSYRMATRLLLIDLRLAGAEWSALDAFVADLRARDATALAALGLPAVPRPENQAP